MIYHVLCVDMGRRISVLTIALLLLISSVGMLFSEEGEHQQKILYLDSYHQGFEWSIGVTEGLLSAFSSHPDIDLSIEYLDSKRRDLGKIEDEYKELFRKKYVDSVIDAIIVSDDNAFNFALENREELAPDIPLIFLGLENFDREQIEDLDNIFGIAKDLNSNSSLDLIYSLHKDTQKIVIIHDQTTTGLAARNWIDKVIAGNPKSSGYEYQYITDVSIEELTNEIMNIEEDSVILSLPFIVDREGEFILETRFFELLNSSGNPIYVSNDLGLRTGIPIGGYLSRARTVGRQAGELTLDIIDGQLTSFDDPIKPTRNELVINYDALRYHGLFVSDLPDGAQILNKPPRVPPSIIITITLLLLVISLLSVLISINHRLKKRAQQNLELLQIVLDYSPIPIVATSMEHERKVLFANAVFCRALKIEKSKIMRLSYDDLSNKIQMYLGEIDFREYDQKVLVQDSVVNLPEVVFTDVQGKEWHISITKSPFIWEDSPAVLTTFFDLSEQYQVQKALRHAEKMQVIGQLAGGIAHDFNNQIMAILGYSDLMRTEITEKTHQEYLRYITVAAENSRALTERLLVFSRKDTSKMDLFDMKESVDNVVGLLKLTIDRQISLSTDYQQGDAVCFGERSLIENALLNIGINAADAIQESGHIIFRVASDETTVTISVQDDGSGIPESVRDKIFEPFFTTKKEGSGTGMGLASVKQTVENHYGIIKVYSSTEDGTLFTIKLPKNISGKVEEDGLPEKSIPTVVELQDESKRVLVIDDEHAIRFLLQKMLEREGYIVDTASNGVDALKQFEPHKYDIVLLDMIMPEMNGYTAFIEMQKLDPCVKVIMVSAFADTEQVEQLRKLGLYDFIKKPVDSKTLIPIIEQAVNVHEIKS